MNGKYRAAWVSNGDVLVAVLLFLLTLAWLIPILVFGTGWIREDWVLLHRTATCKPFACWPEYEYARPLIGALSEFHYRAFRHHPGLLIGYSNVVLAMTASAFYFLLRTRFDRVPATAAALLWIAIPTHTALQHWVGVIHATTATLLAVLSLLCYMRSRSRLGFSLAILSILFYEATFPLIFVGIATVPRLLGQPVLHRKSLIQLSVLGALMFVILIAAVETRDQQLLNMSNVIINVFGFGLFSSSVAAIPIVIGLVAIAVSFYLLIRHHRLQTVPQQLVVIGTIVVVLGTLPFLTTGFDSVFRNGLFDRASMVTGFGTAMIWAGVLCAIARKVSAHQSNTVLMGLALGLSVALFPHSFSLHRDYGQYIKLMRDASATFIRMADTHEVISIPYQVDEQGARIGVVRSTEIRLRANYFHPELNVKAEQR